MARYKVLTEFIENNNGKEYIDVNFGDIEPTHIYRNIYSYNSSFDIMYEQDKCLNRFDLNDSILEKLIDDKVYSKLWVIDPKFINLDIAIKLVKMDQAKYLPKEYLNNEELLNLNNADNKKEYIDYLFNKYKKLVKEKEYLEEEKRALLEEDKRLNGKMDYCLDIMRDITVAKNNLLHLKK